MQAGVDNLLEVDKFQHIRSIEEYRYARDMSTVRLVNIETGKTDYVPKTEMREFWDNLADDDKIEMSGWTYNAFLERLGSTYCYYLKRENSVIAIGGTYPDNLYICLWLLVTEKVSKYPMALGRAVRTGIKKELAVYPKDMCNVAALPDDVSTTHHEFIEKVFNMTHLGYIDTKRLYVSNKWELLECVG